MNGKAERPADKKLAQGLPASSEARLGWNRSLWALDTPSLCQHRLSHLLAPSCLRCHHSFKLGSLQSLPPPPSPHFPPPPTSKTSNPSVIKKKCRWSHHSLVPISSGQGAQAELLRSPFWPRGPESSSFHMPISRCFPVQQPGALQSHWIKHTQPPGMSPLVSSCSPVGSLTLSPR